jgi:hypothetical protein
VNTVVGDLGALLRWVGLIGGPEPTFSAVVSADTILAEVIDFLVARDDGRAGEVISGLTEVQLSVAEWYPTWPFAARLAEIRSAPGCDVDAVLLAPVALAAELALPLATTSSKIADLARPYVPAVVLI